MGTVAHAPPLRTNCIPAMSHKSVTAASLTFMPGMHFFSLQHTLPTSTGRGTYHTLCLGDVDRQKSHIRRVE
jgi:hypothetical protein